MFILYAKKNILEVKQKETVTSGSVNVYTVQFNFNEDWNGLVKTAVFKVGNNSAAVLLDDTNECTIPWEVLDSPMRPLEIGVYGTKDAEIVLPTIWANAGEVKQGTIVRESATDPTPSLMEQLLDAVNKVDEKIQTIELTPGPAGASGTDGITPHIGENGNWFIGDTDTGVAATGPAGADGTNGTDGLNALILNATFTSTPAINTDYLINRTWINREPVKGEVISGTVTDDKAVVYWVVGKVISASSAPYSAKFSTVTRLNGYNGAKGDKGDTGTTFTPAVDDDGNLSWSNNGNLNNPATVNIKGPEGQNGIDGVSPTITTAPNASGDGTTVTIADINGTNTFEILNGLNGEDGAVGPAGVGIPTGGTAGQILSKASSSNYDTQWIDPPENGGESGGNNSESNGPVTMPITRAVTLLADGWDSTGEQIVSVPGVLLDETRQLIQPTPASEYQNEYYKNGILCVEQGYYSLKFKARTIPTTDINVNVVITSTKTLGHYGTVNVFGVVWNYDNPSTVLERISVDSDPYGYVTDLPNGEPSPEVGNLGGSSPFDSFMPWSGIQEYNIIGSSVQYEYGDADFSRTLYDTMVYIPEFWYKVVDDSTSKRRYFYISNGDSNGFKKHPGSGKYVSRYTANSEYKSVSNNQSITSITREAARTNTKSKGNGWQLYDFASLCAVQLLYLVEYADWDSQGKIGRGYIDGNGAQINTGATDSMTYHTGRASGTDGKTAIQYRHIENLWGNLYQFVDGINFNDRVAYVCLDPMQYADDTDTNYTNVGITLATTNGFIKKLGYSIDNDWAIIPDESNESSYIPDRVYGNTDFRILEVGGYWNIGSAGGLFFFHANGTSTLAGPTLGARLLFRP